MKITMLGTGNALVTEAIIPALSFRIAGDICWWTEAAEIRF